jgi:Cu+-exporting ATPase
MTYTVDQSKLAKCYHCGDDCIQSTLHYDEKTFCCDGCKTVYQILNENDLCNFYNIDENPGFKIKTSNKDSFAYLDNEDVINKLVNFRVQGKLKVTLFIPKIHCNSCLWLLEKLHKFNEGIERSEVNFINKEVTISINENKISLRQLVELIDSIGYTPLIQIEKSNKPKNDIDKRLAYQIGIAGFCFGNIMLLSFPEYLGLSDFEKNFQELFNVLNLILALPILFYCSTDYFKSAWYGVKHKTINLDIPISIGIVVLFGRSCWEIATHIGPGYFDSLAGLLFFLLTGKWYQNKTYKAISFERDYNSYFPAAVTKINSEQEVSVLLKDIRKDDILLIRNNEIIPADAILLDHEASIDYSFVTGESIPVSISKNTLIYAGGRQCGPAIRIKASKEVSQSYLLQLWNNANTDQSIQEHQLDQTSKTLSKRFFYLLSIISICTLLFWLWYDSSQAAVVITSVLIVACPCALALTIPFSFGNTIRHLGKHGLYLKNAQSVERLALTTHIVFDKTGTLTQTENSNIDYQGIPLSDLEKQYLATAVRQSTHPISIAIQKQFPYTSLAIESYNEVTSQGLSCSIHSNNIQLGSAYFIGIEEDESINKDNPRAYLKINEEVKGVFFLQAHYREHLDTLFSSLEAEHYEFELLSGDKKRDVSFLKKWFKRDEQLHFEQSPLSKLERIRAIQQTGAKAMMLGDGLNDSGALKESYAGIAISENVYHFTPACEGVLDAKAIHQLPAFMKLSKDAIKVIYMSYFISFSYNIVGLSFAVSGHLTPLVAAILMPTSSVSVVLFATLAVKYFVNKRLSLLPKVDK